MGLFYIGSLIVQELLVRLVQDTEPFVPIELLELLVSLCNTRLMPFACPFE